MKASLSLIASFLLLATPAVAQEPLEATGTDPSAQTSPAPGGMSPGDMAPGMEPGMAPGGPAPGMAPTDEPLERIGAETGQSSGGQPAEVVVNELVVADDGQKLVSKWGVPVDAIAQLDVYDANGKKIGEVDAVLQDKDGEVRGVAVGYGGFLGFGEKGAVVTLDQLQLNDGTLITDVTEDQLSKLPEWQKN